MNRRRMLAQVGWLGSATLFSGSLWNERQAECLAESPFAAAPPANSADPPRIRIGQIGVAHAHANKLSAYRASKSYEVVGIVEPNPELRKKAEQSPAFQGLPWLSRDELFATPGLQAVLVETHVRDLLQNAEACVRAGFHVHVDKPAGSSLKKWKEILSIAQQKSLLVQMGYMYRFNPGILLLHEMLREGWLGDIFEVHTVMSKTIDAETRKELAEFPGGIFFELACHVLDLVIHILGKPDSVEGFMQHAFHEEDRLIDNGLAVLRYPKAIATIKSSAMEVEGFDRRHLTVCGTEGTFHVQPLDNPSAKLTLHRARGKYDKGTHTLSFPKFTRYIADAEDMAMILRKEKKSAFSYEHDLTVQQVLLEACRMND